MENVAIQHINEKELKTYYLNFDENGDKSQELLDILMDSLLEFVFGIDYCNINSPQSHQKFFNACEKLYKEKRNPQKEGDLGEIILHALLRKYLNTFPLTGRFYFAVDKNTNAKSFDVIHILPKPDKKILVLGESKMFKVGKKGIDALVDDIKKHFTADYARKQFVKISALTHSSDEQIQKSIVIPTIQQIDNWEFKLRSANTLDEVIDELCVPLLCTYTYDEYTKHPRVSKEFIEMYEKEMRELDAYYRNKDINKPSCLSIILMLFPIPDKDTLIGEYYKRIDKGCGKS